MAEFKFLPIPTEDYDALGITADTVLQTGFNENGDLVIHAVTGEELEEFVCNGNCRSCPLADIDCDGECLSCPCYANCDDSDFTFPEGSAFPEGACKSHGDRREGGNGNEDL